MVIAKTFQAEIPFVQFYMRVFKETAFKETVNNWTYFNMAHGE